MLYDDLKSNNINDIIVRRAHENCLEEKCVIDHKTGYDIDFYLKNHDWQDFEGYASSNYLKENAYKYGFVMRYNTKQDYDPTHYRYVGLINAYVIKKNNTTIYKYCNSLELNKIYNINDTPYYIYRVSKEDAIYPKNIKYEISTFKEEYYVISFEIKK